MNVGKWRWPLLIALPLVTGGAMVLSGTVRWVYEGHAVLAYSGDVLEMDKDLNMFRSSLAKTVSLDRVVGPPLAISLRADARRSKEVVATLQSVGAACVERSLAAHRQSLEVLRDGFRKQAADLEAPLNRLLAERKALVAGPRRDTPRVQIVAKIEELKTRRRLLIDQYPSHADIPVIARRIRELAGMLDRPSRIAAARITDLDRRINEADLRRVYFLRRMKETEGALQALKPLWGISLPIQKPVWPHEVPRWPWGVGAMLGAFALGFIIFRKERDLETEVQRPASDVLRPSDVTSPTSDVERRTSDEPIAWEIVTPGNPADPLTEKAAELYAKWVQLARILYAPSAQPPQGVLDQVAPLLQESSEFLPDGHDVLARYLAHVVTAGDLPAHVARTVLMTLTGAQEAGVSPEHRLAMALAALFHDLALVARPIAAQVEAGSEVGRLSASVLGRIPGLAPALLSMVEDILVGMDEYKLDTWQNVAQGLTLEPLSKVLREIDRFEKVLQKQKTRLDRRRLGPGTDPGEQLPQSSNA